MDALLALAVAAAERLIARKETIAIAESSSGGLIAAALLSVPGASRYFLGGAVVYTGRARHRLLGVEREQVEGLRSASEGYAMLLAKSAGARLGADWGLSETGAAGPTGNPYGDAAGHSCIALFGPVERVLTVETGASDRFQNMQRFAIEALTLLNGAIEAGRS
jgi:PncC family amidohydrolase